MLWDGKHRSSHSHGKEEEEEEEEEEKRCTAYSVQGFVPEVNHDTHC
jgi:hypothetical protein